MPCKRDNGQGIMKTTIILNSILALLGITAVTLGFLIMQPPQVEPEINFDYVMQLMSEKRASLNEVSINYTVELVMPQGSITGAMTLFTNKTHLSTKLSPELANYSSYAIMLTPERVINAINNSERKEFSGYLENNNETCMATITEPIITGYESIISNDYLFITCFDNKTGYPSIIYAGELKGEEVVYAEFRSEKVFIK